jgi:hypothetical protein
MPSPVLARSAVPFRAPGLSRRAALRSLAGSAVLGTGLVSLGGCGGGGDDGDATTASVSVGLPAGFALPESELESGTAFGVDGVRSGATRASVPGDEPVFAFVRHRPTGGFVLFGLVGGGRTRIDALSTAVAAVALHFGWVGYRGAVRSAVLGLLEKDPAVVALGAQLQSALATDPYAVRNRNAGFQAALRSAIDSLRASTAAANAASQRRHALASLIQVQPSDEQQGARLDQGTAGAVVPTNLKRRPVAFYTYLTGHDPAGSTAVQRVDQQDLVPTGTFLGQIASLNARPAWAPVAGRTVDLPTTGNDDRTFYETVALMGTLDNAATTPAVFADPRYAGEVSEWRAKLSELRVYSCFHSVGTDIFAAASLGGGAAIAFATAQAIRAQIALIASDASALVIAKAIGGGYGEYVQGLMGAISEEYYAFYTSGSTAWRRVGLRLVGLAEAEAEAAALGQAGATIASIALLCSAAILAAGGVVAAVDLGASYSDALLSPLAVQWTETALRARVRLSPERATIAPDQSIVLSTALVGLGGSTGVTYRYTLAGSDLANLGDGQGRIGRSFDTASSTVNLVTTPSTQGDLVVTVEAFRAGVSLGTASATVSVVAQAYALLRITILGDGTLTVTQNGQTVGTAVNGGVGPFPASAGDAFTVVLRGSTTRFAGVGGIVYQKPDGSRVQVFAGATLTSPYPEPQVNVSFTIAS